MRLSSTHALLPTHAHSHSPTRAQDLVRKESRETVKHSKVRESVCESVSGCAWSREAVKHREVRECVHVSVSMSVVVRPDKTLIKP